MTVDMRQGRTAPTGARQLITLTDDLAADRQLCGNKAATLARLLAAGYPGAPGIVVTTSGDAADAPFDVDDADGLTAAIEEHLPTGPVAVRSSSPAEDGAEFSAAGHYVTVLNVRPIIPALAEAVSGVIASAHGEPVAVLIQPMIDALAAGVAFGADPVTGDRGRVHIHAVDGVADGLLAGRVTGERWVLTTDTATVDDGPARVISVDQARDIADLVEALGEHEGGPQDVEWAIDAEGLHLVQCRPITALPIEPQVDLPPGTWLRDRHRYPDGMTALGISIAAPEVSRGMTATFLRCGGLVDRMEMRDVAGRPYVQIVPAGGNGGKPPPGLVLGVLARTVPTLRRRCRLARDLLRSGAMARDIERWDTTDRDAIRRRTVALRADIVEALTGARLAEHLEAATALLRDGLAIHFQLVAAHTIGVQRLIAACRQLLNWHTPDTLLLFSGSSPASDEPTRELDVIAAKIAAEPRFGNAFADAVADGPGDRSTLDILSEIEPDLARAFDAWCGTYGLRTANDDPGSPTLQEIPGLLDGLLRDRIAQAGRRAAPSGESATSPTRSTAPASASALDRAQRILRHHAPEQRALFDRVLTQARRAYAVREDNVLWALSMPAGLVRRAAVEVGRRAHARGELADPRDIVMADITAVIAAARDDVPPGTLREIVARAKAERAWVASHPLPDYYGVPPAGMPSLRWLPRAARLVNEALRLDAPDPAPRRESTGALLTGLPGSPGQYTGPVRLVRTPEQFPQLRPGEVLVCTVTDPAWSVLFAVAGAVIADGGGVLSHAAIIAREHGLPCVLGAQKATTTLTNGQVVTVDGTHGTVHLAFP